MRRFFSKVINRLVITALFMLLQIAVLVGIIVYFKDKFAVLYILLQLFSVCVVVYIINENSNPAYKIAWIVPIMALPVFGSLLYLVFGKNHLNLRQKRRMLGIRLRYQQAMSEVSSAMPELADKLPEAVPQAAYLHKAALAPVFSGCETEYLEPGEALFARMPEALEKAERYIFLEYFIIEAGEMWDAVLEILRKKAAQGLDVRVMYDDFGCIFTLPQDFCKKLGAMGIQCRVFHKFMPVLSGRFNNRDHRKICVIDGKTAFTGGVNLADEYINKKVRLGHWMDSGLMIWGDGAWGFAVMFLSMWDYVNNTEEDYERYRPEKNGCARGRSFVIPYADIPLDDEPVGETVYMNMLNRARSYVYICSPYLVVGNEMLMALTTAAKSGVDVRIITPHIPDKKPVFALTRSYYQVLIEAGVRIFEYTPGFMHSKTFVSDDKYAVCGSINMDFRSMYLHYECAAWLCDAETVSEMKACFLKNLESCQEITLEWCNSRPWYTGFIHSLLRTCAPLV